MISDELICPICDECGAYLNPFLNHEGRWVCGSHWFECGMMIVDTLPKPEKPEMVEEVEA